jgi:hypothetical protein
MSVTLKDYFDSVKNYKITKKSECDCVCNLTFEIECGNDLTCIVDVIVDKSLDNDNLVTYFRWNWWDDKDTPYTYGWYSPHTTIIN